MAERLEGEDRTYRGKGVMGKKLGYNLWGGAAMQNKKGLFSLGGQGKSPFP